MKFPGSIVLAIFIAALNSCNTGETGIEILQSTIEAIDSIESVYYKQDMSRTNPQNDFDTIFSYREMYFKRLISDSIVGVKGHWYMYSDDKENVVYEDIYDGKRLIRKNNRDSAARIYDLIKYPEFRKKHFWSHNTLFGMQYEFKIYIDNPDIYTIERLNDTAIRSRDCYQVQVILLNKTSMPGFAIKPEDYDGIISKTYYFIEKQNYYPIGFKNINYLIDNPEQKSFINQIYYDIDFNLIIDERLRFNTSDESLEGFDKSEIKPD